MTHSGTREGRILGDDHFAEDALRRAGEKMKWPVSMEEIGTQVCRWYGLEPTALAEHQKEAEVLRSLGNDRPSRLVRRSPVPEPPVHEIGP